MKLEATLHGWSVELGEPPESLARRLRLAGVKFERGVNVSAFDMFRALSGGLREAQAREANARAELLESLIEERKGVVLPHAEVQTIMRNVLLPIRQHFLSLPSFAGHLCNPSDPELARKALQEWVETSMAIVREESQKLSEHAKRTPSK